MVTVPRWRRPTGRPLRSSVNKDPRPVRGFASLFFAAALAAHLVPAGAPSLGTGTVCTDVSGVTEHAPGQILYLATALGSTQAEAASDRQGRAGGAGPRRTHANGVRNAPQAPRDTCAQPSEAFTPASLLAFPNHPTTAPPQQA